jgi:hypothetical protein
VMSLTPMAPSAWRYYVEEISRGREDYYAMSAEHAGLFMGRGAEALGISSMEAGAISLERLFGHGVDPRDGSSLGRGFSPKDSRAVAGFALTFSPPKTVSVLWALADLDIANEVAAAHDAAVSLTARRYPAERVDGLPPLRVSRRMSVNVIAHNLARWVPSIGLGPKATPMTTKTTRLPGRITGSGRRKTLHLP